MPAAIRDTSNHTAASGRLASTMPRKTRNPHTSTMGMTAAAITSRSPIVAQASISAITGGTYHAAGLGGAAGPGPGPGR